ncbi:hypothetical protein N5C93_16330 [Pseudomonas nitroreducens]|uniref:hypothetical protein n=1 Tax=Pseudomonas nitroreducens TaxID=46680 RepID=UPI0014734FA5|nr:hypothetical protein [Pseudomonas nitroreducens]MDG9855347.1 hypothetical protein [Pseudomonas nitroreducens]MDH1074410.1 hypothetical protein [Pseudomonas nitroreducens]NMZ73074.1 hypothetical protein [Pseudomonas nitroreducens]
MDLSRIARKRQKSVQDQNALLRESIRKCAAHFREAPEQIPPVLIDVACERNVDWSKTILLDLGVREPGCSSLMGLLLDQSGRFIEFELDATDDLSSLVELYVWKDISAEQNCSQHNRGIGVGYGALALAVQADLNRPQGLLPVSEE